MIFHFHKKRLNLIATYICILIFMLCSCTNKKNIPVAENGVLDLTDWDFEQNGYVILNGPWNFIWMKDSGDFLKPDYNASGWERIEVPTTWKRTVNQSYGYGWLGLKVILKADHLLRLSIKNTLGASDLYCNGKKIISFGIAGNSYKNYYPERTTKDILLPATDTLFFAWKVVNFDDRLGGPRHAIRIGTDEEYSEIKSKTNCRQALIFGIIFIMSLYHLLLWYRRRNDLASLYFGLFCLVILIRHFTTDVVHSSFINTMGHFRTLYKIEFLTLPFGCSVFMLFIARLFPNDISKKTLRIILLLNLFLAALTIITNSRIFTSVLIIYELSVCLTIIVCLIILIKAISNRREYSKLLLAGFIVISLAVAFEIITTHSYSDSRFIISAGLVLFIFIQSMILSFKFADAYNTARHLTEHLKEDVNHITEDIRLKSSELVKMNLELQKADEYKTRFFQNITHEFKTPLTLITGPIQTILKGQYGVISDTLRKQLEMVKHHGQQAINLVNQLLELAQTDEQQIRLKLSKCHINETLITIVSHFKPLAEKSKINLSFKTEDDKLVYSFIDLEKFERIFFNLLSNAFKFTGENGIICINLKYMQIKGEKKYSITVKDTGIGISKENLSLIFKRFYKSYSPEIPDAQGTGIGLSLVKEYTSLHGASIEVNSTVNVGTGFELIFPLIEKSEDVCKYFTTENALIEFTYTTEPGHLIKDEINSFIHQADDTDMTKSEDEVSNLSDGQKKDKTILVIEDIKEMRSYIKDILKDEYEVLEAKNGEAGFQVVLDKMPDLIVSDVMMPKLDGIQLCKKIKTDVRTEHIPLILLTARSTCPDSIEGYMTGADDYITKPFSRDLLVIRIQNIIETRDKLREHYKLRFLSEPVYTQVESKVELFICKAVRTVESHISDPKYDVEQFARDTGISQIQLYRKLNAVMGQSPAEFIRIVRLKRAAKILEESLQKDINVSEIAYSLGFINHSHFSQLFKKHYGISPTDYAKKFS